MSPVEKYIHAIKNPSKKAYAQAYVKHIRHGGSEPERPKNLSYMGAQAVRMSLYELTSPKHETESGDAYLERFSRPAGGKRRKTIATKGKWTRNPSNVITLRKTGTDPWFIWRDESAALRITIQRVDFSDHGYHWEVVAQEGRLRYGTASFKDALAGINKTLEFQGYNWRVTAKAPSAGGKKRHGGGTREGRPYVGSLSGPGGPKEVFRSKITPTWASTEHRYTSSTGPFRTVSGARVWSESPEYMTQEMAEGLARDIRKALKK